MAHLERREDVPLDEAGVRLAARSLNDQAQQVIVEVAVLEAGAGRARERETGEALCLTLGGIGRVVQVSQEVHAGYRGQAAGLVEQLAHGDLGGCLRVCHAKPGQVALRQAHPGRPCRPRPTA